MRSSFYVSLLAPGPIATEEYSLHARKMVEVFTSLLTDKAKIATLTRNAALSLCHTELEVQLLEDGGLLGRAVVDMEAEVRVSFDKTKLSRELKGAAPWKNCKVEKRAMDSEEVGDPVSVEAAVVA